MVFVKPTSSIDDWIYLFNVQVSLFCDENIDTLFNVNPECLFANSYNAITTKLSTEISTTSRPIQGGCRNPSVNICLKNYYCPKRYFQGKRGDKHISRCQEYICIKYGRKYFWKKTQVPDWYKLSLYFLPVIDTSRKICCSMNSTLYNQNTIMTTYSDENGLVFFVHLIQF